jgi:2-phospho-L-lactate/phosphoenolpyruvate guanylyltransferase
MKTFAIIPIKSLHNAKTRLASVLSPAERAELARDMLLHVVDILSRSGAVEGIAVISQEPSELDLPASVTILPQTLPGLNNLLEQGREWAVSNGAHALLTIFADLPLLTTEDISRIVGLGMQPGTVVLAPDRHNCGTNALLSHPPALARFAFGPSSLDAHVALARSAGATVHLLNAPGLALDIDTLDDLAYLEAHRIATAMEYAFS